MIYCKQKERKASSKEKSKHPLSYWTNVNHAIEENNCGNLHKWHIGKKKNQTERERLAQKRKNHYGICTVHKRRKQNLTKKLHVPSTYNKQNLGENFKELCNE